MSRKAGAGASYYDDDDFDDGYDDEDDYEYDEYDDTVTAAGNTAKGSHGHKAAASKAAAKAAAAHKPHAPAAAAGASAMAQCLSDPPPRRPDGRPQRGANTHVAHVRQPGSFPLSPAAQQAAGFDFSTPSPDDRAKAAGPSGRPTVGISLAPSKTPTVRQQQAAAAARKQQAGGAGGVSSSSSSALASQHSIDNALHDLDALHLSPTKASAAAAAASASVSAASDASVHGSVASEGVSEGGSAAAAAAAAKNKVPWRPLADYKMEPDLAKEVAKATAAEASTSGSSSSSGGRRGLHLVVMGHVDAGKSTLMGRLLHDLGQVSQKEVHKNQRESAQAGKASFSWAWVLDERPEERARGVTVDVALARFKTPKHDVTLLDAPGHRDFVPNMISGATLADAALLLVDGSPGGFEAGFMGGPGGGGGVPAFALGGGRDAASGGQTKEHAQLAKSLGVDQLAVVISKLDTCDYSQERFEYIQSQLLPFLKSVGFKEQSLQWLPAVGPAGQNLKEPPTEPLLASWWKGPTLVQAIDAFVPKPRNTGAPVRLPVQDVFKGRQGGICVGGKLEAGALRPGSKVLVVPGYVTAAVKGLEVNSQDHAQLALAGDSADLVLSGVEPSALHAGCVLCNPEFPVRLAVKFLAQVLVLDVGLPLLKGHAVTIHTHSAREAGVISHLVALCDSKTGAVTKQRPRCLIGGQTATVEVTPVRPLPLEVFADLKALGRVALREGGRTIAVGIVTHIHE